LTPTVKKPAADTVMTTASVSTEATTYDNESRVMNVFENLF
jgi:hypothetical protein